MSAHQIPPWWFQVYISFFLSPPRGKWVTYTYKTSFSLMYFCIAQLLLLLAAVSTKASEPIQAWLEQIVCKCELFTLVSDCTESHTLFKGPSKLPPSWEEGQLKLANHFSTLFWSDCSLYGSIKVGVGRRRARKSTNWTCMNAAGHRHSLQSDTSLMLNDIQCLQSQKLLPSCWGNKTFCPTSSATTWNPWRTSCCGRIINRISSIAPALLLDSSMSNESTPKTFLCISFWGRLVTVNTIAWVTQYTKSDIWHQQNKAICEKYMRWRRHRETSFSTSARSQLTQNIQMPPLIAKWRTVSVALAWKKISMHDPCD